MAHELVLDAQAFRVHHAVFADHHSVLERAAAGEAHRAQHFDIAGKAVGAGEGKVAGEHAGGELHRHLLHANVLVVILDTGAQRQHVAVRGRQRGALGAFAHFDGFENADALAGRALRFLAGQHQKFIEHGGRAIHDRHFGAVDFDAQVVDPDAGDGGKQVLDHGDRDPMRVRQRGAKLGIGDRVGVGLNFAGALGGINADEADTGIGRGGQQRQAGARTGVYAYPGAADLARNRCLPRVRHVCFSLQPGTHNHDGLDGPPARRTQNTRCFGLLQFGGWARYKALKNNDFNLQEMCRPKATHALNDWQNAAGRQESPDRRHRRPPAPDGRPARR